VCDDLLPRFSKAFVEYCVAFPFVAFGYFGLFFSWTPTVVGLRMVGVGKLSHFHVSFNFDGSKPCFCVAGRIACPIFLNI
jgi:hypothetical protein